MAYGIAIYEPNGDDFIVSYTPYNVIDAITLTASGSKTYTLAAGESIRISEASPYINSGACCVISISGGKVSWVNKSSPSAANVSGSSGVAVQGSLLFVLKVR